MAAPNDQTDLAVVVKYARHWHEYRESHNEYEMNRAAGFRSQDWLPRGCDFPSDEEQDESGVIWVPRPSQDDDRPAPAREPITRLVEKAIQVTLADTRKITASQPSNEAADISASTEVRDAHTMTSTYDSTRDKQRVFVAPAKRKETAVPDAPTQRELSQRLLTLRKSRGLNSAAAWDIPLDKTPKPKPTRFLRAAPKAATNVHATAAAALETALREASVQPTRAAAVQLAASQLRDRTTDDEEDKSTVADWDETHTHGKSRLAKKRADRHAVRLATILGRCAHAQGADDAALESLVDTALRNAGPLAIKDPSFRAAADAVRFATTLARHAYAGGARDTDVREMVERVLESDDACSQQCAAFRAAAEAVRGTTSDAVKLLAESNETPELSLSEAKCAMRSTSDPQVRLAFVNSSKDTTVQRLADGGLANTGATVENNESTKRTPPLFQSADYAVRLATELGRRAHAIGATDAQVDRLVDDAFSDFEDTNKQDTLGNNAKVRTSYSLYRVSYDAVRLATKFARRAFVSGAKDGHVQESVNNLLLSQDDKGPSHICFRAADDAVRFVTTMGRRAYAIEANDTGVERMVEDALREQIEEFGDSASRSAAFSSSIKSADCEIDVDRVLGDNSEDARQRHPLFRDSAAALRVATKVACSAYARGVPDADVEQLVEKELQGAGYRQQIVDSSDENFRPATAEDRHEAQESWDERSDEAAIGSAKEGQHHSVESGVYAADMNQHAYDALGKSFDNTKHDSHSFRAAIGMIRSATKLARRAYMSGAEDAQVKDLVECVLQTDGSARSTLQTSLGRTVDTVHLVMSMGHRASATGSSEDDVERLVDGVLRELGSEHRVPLSLSATSFRAGHTSEFEHCADRSLGLASDENHFTQASHDTAEEVHSAAKLAPSAHASSAKDACMEQYVGDASRQTGSTHQSFQRAEFTDLVMPLGRQANANKLNLSDEEKVVEDVHGESNTNVREQHTSYRDECGTNDLEEQTGRHAAGAESPCLNLDIDAPSTGREVDTADAQGAVVDNIDQNPLRQHSGGSDPDSTKDLVSIAPTSNVSADTASLEAPDNSAHVHTPRRARSESPIKQQNSLGGRRLLTARSKSPVRSMSIPSKRQSTSNSSTKSNASSGRSSNRSSTGDLRSAARSARLAARLAERGVDDETARAAKSAARIVAAAGIKESDRASSVNSSWTAPASGRSSPESVMRRVAAAADMPVKQEIRTSLEEIAKMVQDLENVAARKSTPPRRSADSPPGRDLARRPRSRTPSPLRAIPRERTPSPRRSWADDELLVPVTVSTLADDEYKPRLRTVAERTEINDAYSVCHPPRDGDQPHPALIAMGAPRQRRVRREPRLLPSGKEEEIQTDVSLKLLGGDDDSTIPTRPEVAATQRDDASVLSPPPPPPDAASKLSDRGSSKSDSKRDGRLLSENKLPVFFAADANATERQMCDGDPHLYSALRQYDGKRAMLDEDISARQREADEWSDV